VPRPTVVRAYAYAIIRTMKMESHGLDADQYEPEVADKRRDQVVVRMLATAPQPHPKAKPGRKRGRPVAS